MVCDGQTLFWKVSHRGWGRVATTNAHLSCGASLIVLLRMVRRVEASLLPFLLRKYWQPEHRSETVGYG
jgi:hypothetical protein